MTKPEFDAAVDKMMLDYGGSMTSGRRTIMHDAYIQLQAKEPLIEGGPHTWGFGADVIWDTTPGEAMDRDAHGLGLRPITTHTHTHFQPIDWVNRPH